MTLTRPVAIIQERQGNIEFSIENRTTTKRVSARTLRFACFFVVVGFLAAMPVFAQLQAGRIVGQVFDPQHASVVGATITVTNPATNISETVKSDASGNYVVTPLDPGTYSVSVSAQGFETEVRSGIELTVGQAAEVDLDLHIGAANAKVEVTTEGPILETQS